VVEAEVSLFDNRRDALWLLAGEQVVVAGEVKRSRKSETSRSQSASSSSSRCCRFERNEVALRGRREV